MRTPAGKECRYYYENFFRGNEHQECRLIARSAHGKAWKPSHCNTCPVPEILRNNACPNLALSANVKESFLGLKQEVKVYAVCTKHMCEVDKPSIGCGHCHDD
jgi:hypothetical protein